MSLPSTISKLVHKPLSLLVNIARDLQAMMSSWTDRPFTVRMERQDKVKREERHDVEVDSTQSKVALDWETSCKECPV
ncbi:hypothetical protein N7523_009816 [Penicillium sp. IBT 18751x]|nr:hypothetical protein N7523_009816 [Penicillium sp. IBT 18751x]